MARLISQINRGEMHVMKQNGVNTLFEQELPVLLYCKENVLEIINQVQSSYRRMDGGIERTLSRHGLWSSKSTFYLIIKVRSSSKNGGEDWMKVSPHYFKKLIKLLYDELDENGQRFLTLYDNHLFYRNQPDALYHSLSNFFAKEHSFNITQLVGTYTCFKTSVVDTKKVLMGNVEVKYDSATNTLSTIETQIYHSGKMNDTYVFHGVITPPNKSGRCFWLSRDSSDNQEQIRAMQVIHQSSNQQVLKLSGWSKFSYAKNEWLRGIFLLRNENMIQEEVLNIDSDKIPQEY